MTTLKTVQDRTDFTTGRRDHAETIRQVPVGEAASPRRSKLEWDETMLDYTAIEKRAQEMRSEAAWNMFSSIRDWTVSLFHQGKAKARAAASAPLESPIQSS